MDNSYSEWKNRNILGFCVLLVENYSRNIQGGKTLSNTNVVSVDFFFRLIYGYQVINIFGIFKEVKHYQTTNAVSVDFFFQVDLPL